MAMKISLLWLSFLLVLSHSTYAENFPRPAELERDVQFWLKVYTDATTKQGYIHDQYNLAVVYEKIDVTGSRTANRRLIKARKQFYADILKVLATGKRNNLSADERRVLTVWTMAHTQGEVDAKILSRAADSMRFQLGQANRFRQGLIRAGEWRPYIDATFRDLNLPLELTALPHVESSFNPAAYSHVGAAGLWQFIRSTGRRYMQIDYVVDERMDPFAATIAAAKLLRHNYNLTESWPLALTAYNHGVASMRRAIKQLGTRDIAMIARQYKGRSFGFASRNFYVAFLAALEVDKNPEKYFGTITSVTPYDYTEIKLDHYLYSKDIAQALGVRESILKQHNRSLLDSIWNGNKRVPKGYILRVPKRYLTASGGRLLASIAPEKLHTEQTPDLFHTVVRGDTISEIAQRYGYRVSEVLAANAMRSGHYIRIGQKLRLPVADQKVELDTVAVAEPIEKALVAEQPAVIEPTPLKAATAIAPDELNDIAATPSQINQQEAASLLTDPADYTVDDADRIIVQAEETLGHYAEWLDLRASRLRQINNMRFATPVIVGRRIALDFSRIPRQEFEQRRINYQKQFQEQYFVDHRIESTYMYTIKRGESLWHLAAKRFKVPMWLLRQHNPDVNFARIKPGMKIVVPVVNQAA